MNVAPLAAERLRPAAALEAESHDALEHAIHEAAHLLPSQGPISVFVHHNTLHAFEDLSFAEALERSVQIYGFQPYLSEDRYRQELNRGRIRPDDLTAVLQDDLGEEADELIGVLGTRFHLRRAMLMHALHSAPTEELRWVIAETDAARAFRADVPEETRRHVVDNTRRWIMREFRNGHGQASPASHPPELIALLDNLFETFEKASIEQWSESTWTAFTLQLLWRICVQGAGASWSSRPAPPAPRHRDALLEATDEDADELVHDLLIRFCAAFLDQGFAHWALPGRESGFLVSFCQLYGMPGRATPRWLKGLQGELRRIQERGASPRESIAESLEALGVDADERSEYIAATLLALPGWAGMIWQLETNAEWAAWPAPAGTLVEFLAVRLILDRFAAAHLGQTTLRFRGDLRDLRETASRRRSLRGGHVDLERAFQFFQLAQLLGLTPEELHGLPHQTWSRLAAEVAAFPELQRRRTFHLAYERRYRHQTLDAIAVHAPAAIRRHAARTSAPDFQFICCIDEREESFRRHLEEVAPHCETFGYAGFFGVAMYYRGASDAHARPLCPVVIKPKHYVEELPVFTFEQSHQRRARTRRWLGAASHTIHRGSRSLVGGALTAIGGSLATAPLVARILFPRTSAQIRRIFGRFVQAPEVTQLLLERTELEPGPEEGHVGYAVDEMTDIVERWDPLESTCRHASLSIL